MFRQVDGEGVLKVQGQLNKLTASKLRSIQPDTDDTRTSEACRYYRGIHNSYKALRYRYIIANSKLMIVNAPKNQYRHRLLSCAIPDRRFLSGSEAGGDCVAPKRGSVKSLLNLDPSKN